MALSKEINVLLLGESGSGKSLFINSFANYIRFESLDEAVSSKDLVCPIPFRFTITDVNGIRTEVKGGPTSFTERTSLGESSTMKCTSYVFRMGDATVRLVDTPGIGSTEGEYGDRVNLEQILSSLGQLDRLQAVAVVLSNREPRLTERFAYCLRGLLTHLERSAARNLLFVLTGSEGANYQPSEVKEAVQLLLRRCVPQMASDRTYCVDNKAFHFLAAAHQRLLLDPEFFASYDRAWTKSANEVRRLLAHVSKLEPHDVKNTMRIHEARRFICIMETLLPEMYKNIDENGKMLLEDVQSPEMYTQMDLEFMELGRSNVCCTSARCRMSLLVQGQKRFYYPRVCCEDCKAFFPFGWLCRAIDFRLACKHCGCAASQHVRKSSTAVPVRTPRFLLDDDELERMRTEDDLVRAKLRARREMLAEAEVLFQEAERVCALFLQAHALTPMPMLTGSAIYNPNHAEARLIGRHSVDRKKGQRVTLEDLERVKRKLLLDILYGKKIASILEKNQPLTLQEKEFTGQVATRFKHVFA